MRVFVTGETGHSDSHVIPELASAGHEVTALARWHPRRLTISASRCSDPLPSPARVR
jgi:nucleoside-diphosphate-sugar epimerase